MGNSTAASKPKQATTVLNQADHSSQFKVNLKVFTEQEIQAEIMAEAKRIQDERVKLQQKS